MDGGEEGLVPHLRGAVGHGQLAVGEEEHPLRHLVSGQPTPQPGTTRVAVEVVKPDPDGVGPGTVVGRTETVVEWTAPQVSLDVGLPPAVALNRETPVAITLAPRCLPSCTAAMPTPPVAPCTSRTSPALSPPR